LKDAQETLCCTVEYHTIYHSVAGWCLYAPTQEVSS